MSQAYECKSIQKDKQGEDHDLVSYSKERLEQVLGHAPSDSIVRLLFEHAANESKVVLTLYSETLIFAVTEVAKSPYMAVEKVLNDLKQRLWEWQVTRFDVPHAQKS